MLSVIMLSVILLSVVPLRKQLLRLFTEEGPFTDGNAADIASVNEPLR